MGNLFSDKNTYKDRITEQLDGFCYKCQMHMEIECDLVNRHLQSFITIRDKVNNAEAAAVASENIDVYTETLTILGRAIMKMRKIQFILKEKHPTIKEMCHKIKIVNTEIEQIHNNTNNKLLKETYRGIDKILDSYLLDNHVI